MIDKPWKVVEAKNEIGRFFIEYFDPLFNAWHPVWDDEGLMDYEDAVHIAKCVNNYDDIVALLIKIDYWSAGDNEWDEELNKILFQINKGDA